MDIEKLTKDMNEFVDLIEIFGHMPKHERSKKKMTDVQKKLLDTITEIRTEVTKEVRAVKEDG